MLTGFNTDVQYDGRVFHVQTEDKGLANPSVESLVYTGGEIVGSQRSSYADIAGAPTFSETELHRRMEAQHQAVIREVLSGRYDPEGPKPFGYNIITNRSLDEVVLDFLSREVGVNRIRLEVEDQQGLEEGTRPTLRLRVLAEESERPVVGARVVVKLLTTRERPRELFSGATASDGRVEATIELPEIPDASTAVVCQAEASGSNAELKQLVRKLSRDS